MSVNFINRKDRTYLVENPDMHGVGEDLGFYYQGFNGVTAVALKPYRRNKDFETVKEAQHWLKTFCH